MALVFRSHALRRMFQRRVSTSDIHVAPATGEDIEEYPHDSPYPSRLVLGNSVGRPLHIVVADNAADFETIVITVYEPDPALWSADFKTRL